MTYNPAQALECAKLCQRAYDGPNVIKDNAQALVLRDPLRVAIAGTNDRKDVRQDADFDLVPAGTGEVHRGFLAHFATLWEHLGPMATARLLDAPPLLTGHSLGAACAVLAVLLKPYLFRGSTVYLFGCPAVGNAAFAADFGRVCKGHGITVWRVVNVGDPVATIRPLRYHHVGQEIEIGDGLDLPADHPIAAYIQALEDDLAV